MKDNNDTDRDIYLLMIMTKVSIVDKYETNNDI